MQNVGSGTGHVQPVNENERFLASVFGSKGWAAAHVVAFRGDPGAVPESVWRGGRAGEQRAQIADPEANTYYCVSKFRGSRRTEAAWVALYVVMIDDVGTKVDVELVLARMGPPSHSVQTSPGNFQWVYVLDRPETDLARAKALVNGIAKRVAAKDPGQRGVNRLARLPVGTNHKAAYGPGGSAHRHVLDRPEATFLQDDLARTWDFELPGGGRLAATGAGGLLGDQAGNQVQDKGQAGDKAGDYLFDALEDMGWLENKTSSTFGYHVRCPNQDAHGPAAHEAGCAYRPARGGGVFVCHHGSCAGLTWGDFYARVGAAFGAAELAKREFGTEPLTAEDRDGSGYPRPAEDKAEMFLARHVFLRPDDAFFDMRSQSLIPRRSVNSEWGVLLARHLTVPTPRGGAQIAVDRWFFEQPGRQIADGIASWPGEGARFVHPDGRELVNTYRAPLYVPRVGPPVSKAEIAPWLELVRHVWDKASMRALVHFLDWAAGVVVEPALKPGFMICVQGAQGLGKDLMMQPVRAGVGETNAEAIKGSALVQDFNAWAAKRLVVVSELRQTTQGTSSGHDQYNSLKNVVDTSMRTRVINPKFGRKYVARDVCAVFTSTNEANAIALESDDRRVLVVMSGAKPWPKVRYAMLLDWMAKGGEALVVQWLHERWAAAGAARRRAVTGNAPETRDKKGMFLSGDEVQSWIYDRVEEAGPDWPDVMSAEDVVGVVRRAIESNSSGLSNRLRAPGVTRAGQMLAAVGAVKLAKGEPVRLRDGRRVRLWALRRHTAFATLGGAALAGLMASGKLNGFTGTEVVDLKPEADRDKGKEGTSA